MANLQSDLMRLCVIIPVKRLSSSKARLASHLSSRERKDLTLKMLRSVLKAVLTMTRDVIIIGSDKEVKKTSEDHDVVFEQDRTSSLNEAVGQAIKRAIHRKFDAVLVVAADLPFLSSVDLRRLMEELRDESVVICPSKDCGTNALFLSPPQSIGVQFGSHSLVSHLKAAMGSRRKFKIFWSSGLSFDVDTPRDLKVAAQRGKKLHAL